MAPGALLPAGLADALDAALPQTQCTRCGFPDCRSYAQAIAGGAADINQCPPGGAEGIARLAALTGRPVLPLNPAHGHEGPRLLAVIDEAACIGCTLCLAACPVDSILGGAKQMHTVIAPWCTGCELCVPACPVDCIALRPVNAERSGWQAWSSAQAAEARERFGRHRQRLQRDEDDRSARLSRHAPTAAAASDAGTPAGASPAPDAKRAMIEAALERARKRRA